MILKFLPKAATATVIFQNHPFSPGREKRFHHHHNHNHHKGFSGPIISIIPAEARSRKSNNVTNQEPTSPKVSCIGQIKQRKSIKKTKKEGTSTKTPLEKITSTKKSSRSNFRNFFQRGRKSDADDTTSISSDVQNKAPSLSHMRKFASGREGSLSNFDWKNVQITPEDHRKYYSDDDREDYTDEDDEEEKEVIIPFSAPILVGRDNRPNFPLEPKKEINLWKRRTMTQPNPLQLKK